MLEGDNNFFRVVIVCGSYFGKRLIFVEVMRFGEVGYNFLLSLAFFVWVMWLLVLIFC